MFSSSSTFFIFFIFLSSCSWSLSNGQFTGGQFGQLKTLNPAMNLPQSSQICSCHLTELEKCSGPMLQVSSLIIASAFPDPLTEFKTICLKLTESRECRDKYFIKCASPQMRENIHRLMFQESDSYSETFCANYSSLYQLKAKCLHEVRPLTQSCSIHLKPATVETDKSKQIISTCNMMNDMLNCTNDIVRENCGQDAVDLMSAISKAVGGNSAKVVCDNFAVNFDKCTNSSSD